MFSALQALPTPQCGCHMGHCIGRDSTTSEPPPLCRQKSPPIIVLPSIILRLFEAKLQQPCRVHIWQTSCRHLPNLVSLILSSG